MDKQQINQVFKQVFKAFAKEVLKADERFINHIDDCDTYEELKEVLGEWSDEFVKYTGGTCSYCEEKDIEIKDLEDEKENLEDSVSDLEGDIEFLQEKLSISYCPETLSDVYKLEAFKRNVDRFSVSEIESLLD